MATDAVLLFEHTFDGVGYPTWETWPGFSWPTATGANNPFPKPVVDGKGHGIPSRSVSWVNWLAKSDNSPGLADYQAELWGKWSNPGFSGDREIVLLFRMKDGDNLLAVGVKSKIGASPELRLYQVAGGVWTQRGATVTHATLSATRQAAGMRWRARVEDLLDGSGESKVTVYIHPGSPADKGTQVLEWQGDIGELRGAWTVGVGLRGSVGTLDVWVDDLRCYDLSDEWLPGGSSPAPGTGWAVELGSKAYSLAELAALEPKVKLSTVTQGYGLEGNTATLTVLGSWSKTPLLKPGLPVRILHDGDVRFRGWIEDGGQSATPQEGQDWHCGDGYFASRQVELEEDDHDGTHWFNVEDEQAEEHDPDRQGMTLGDVLKWLFDRYTARLRFYGAAPPTGTPYVTSELAALDAEITNLSVTGTFASAIDTVLRFMGHRFMLWWDPADLVWHFRDVTSLTAETVECTAEHVKLRCKPDRTKAFTAVTWRGSRRERADDVTLSLSEKSLTPGWTKEQEDTYSKKKRTRSVVVVTVVSAGLALDSKGILRGYVDIATGTLDNGDVIGWVATVGGSGHLYLVTENSSTRIFLSHSAWPSVPPPGTRVTLNAVAKEAWPYLSAMGIGTTYIVRPGVICPQENAFSSFGGSKRNFPQSGFCGTARVSMVGADGMVHAEQYEYDVKFPNATQRAAGFCDPVATLSKKPLPTVGLVNRTPPKSSVPLGTCTPGVQNKPAQVPQVDVQLQVPQNEEDVPYFREPPGEDDWEGPAFEQWGVKQVFPVNDPDFTDYDAQEPGRRKAAQHILAVKSQLPYMFDVELASPWQIDVFKLGRPTRAATSTWAGLGKRVCITSAKRTTGFEDAVGIKLPVLRVEWDVEGNRTILSCGTVSAFLQLAGVDVAKAFNEKRVLARALAEVKRLEDFRNCLLGKDSARVRNEGHGGVDGCDVSVSNQQTRRVVNVQKDDEDKVRNITHQAMLGSLREALSAGVPADFPGSPIAVPGRDGAGARQAIDGPVTRSLADPAIPFQGPVPGHEGLGYYGGQLVTDAEADGAPPREVLRAGGYVFRKREDATGNPDGGPGVEFATIDAHGNPTGGWTPFTRPSDLPNGVWPLTALSPGSTQHQLLERTDTMAKRLLLVQDAMKRIVEPGKPGAGAVTAAPSDLLAHLIAGLLGPHFRIMYNSVDDPGGLVFLGPYLDGDAAAAHMWRVHPTARVPIRVQAASGGLGTGTNGGDWEPVMTGGAFFYLRHGYIHDKQVHLGADWEVDGRHAAVGAPPGVAEPGHPFLATGHLLQFSLGAAGQSGFSFTVPVPKGATGIPYFWADVGEDPFAPNPVPGLTARFRIDWAYHASAWTPASPGANNDPVLTAGAGPNAGTGGGQFKQPGGAVPPGLRKVTVSVSHVPGAGTLPIIPGSAPVLAGGGIRIAVVDGGWLLVVPEGLAFADVAGHNFPGTLEGQAIGEEWALEVGKAFEEELVLLEAWDVVLNPPLVCFEEAELEEAWTFDVELALAEGLDLAEEWDLVLNP